MVAGVQVNGQEAEGQPAAARQTEDIYLAAFRLSPSASRLPPLEDPPSLWRNALFKDFACHERTKIRSLKISCLRWCFLQLKVP